MSEQRHDPLYLLGGGSSWARCSCGWESGGYRGPTGAQLAHGQHLLAVAAPVRLPEGDQK